MSTFSRHAPSEQTAIGTSEYSKSHMAKVSEDSRRHLANLTGQALVFIKSTPEEEMVYRLVFDESNAKTLERVLSMYDEPLHATHRFKIERLLKTNVSHRNDDQVMVKETVIEIAARDDWLQRIISESAGLASILQNAKENKPATY